jgi:hypothetical protein
VRRWIRDDGRISSRSRQRLSFAQESVTRGVGDRPGAVGHAVFRKDVADVAEAVFGLMICASAICRFARTGRHEAQDLDLAVSPPGSRARLADFGPTLAIAEVSYLSLLLISSARRPASSPTPWMNEDFSFDWSCRPRKYTPAQGVTPRRWTGRPAPSKRGSWIQPKS